MKYYYVVEYRLVHIHTLQASPKLISLVVDANSAITNENALQHLSLQYRGLYPVVPLLFKIEIEKVTQQLDTQQHFVDIAKTLQAYHRGLSDSTDHWNEMLNKINDQITDAVTQLYKHK